MRMSQNKTLLAASICAALASQTADAATFNVTTTDDAGAGSLRQALADANANAEADVIDLSAISGQTISLTTGELAVAYDDVTIDGAGVTIDAGGNSRVLAGYYSDLTLNDLTLTGGVVTGGGGGLGDLGGGLNVLGGSLTMDNCTISGNTALDVGGVLAYTFGPISISNTTISGNTADDVAGGVYLYAAGGDLSILDSTITGNVAGVAPRGAGPVLGSLDNPDDRRLPMELVRPEFRGKGGGGFGGGALAAYGVVTVERTTISGNDAGLGQAGGVVLYGGGVVLRDSTISGNTAGTIAGGGIIGSAKYDAVISNSTVDSNAAGYYAGGLYLFSYASSTIEFSTITGNSAGYAGGGFYYLQEGAGMQHNTTIVSGNTALAEPDILLDAASTINAEFSLVGVAPTGGTLNADAVTVGLLGVDPALDPLAANGGPTETRLPAMASPVVDQVPGGSAGCGGAVTTDQRGLARPSGSACDIGAVEFSLTDVGARSIPTLDRMGLWLMTGLLGLAAFFGFRRRSRTET